MWTILLLIIFLPPKTTLVRVILTFLKKFLLTGKIGPWPGEEETAPGNPNFTRPDSSRRGNSSTFVYIPLIMFKFYTVLYYFITFFFWRTLKCVADQYWYMDYFIYIVAIYIIIILCYKASIHVLADLCYSLINKRLFC